MATFAGIPLLEALKFGEDQIERGLVEMIVEGSPMLMHLPHKPVTARLLEKTHEGTLPSAQFRAVNDAPAPVHGSVDKTHWGCAILHADSRIDIAELHSGLTVEAEFRSKIITDIAKSMSMRYNLEAFQGDGTNNGFGGFENLVAAGFGVQHNQTAGPLNFDELDLAWENLDKGDPDAIFSNKRLVTRALHRARSGFTQFTLVDTGQDALGRPVTQYRGVPWHKILRGMNASGTIVDVLPFDEASTTSSVYLARFDEHDGVCGLLGNGATVSVRWIGESSEGPYETARGEFYPGLAAFDTFSLVRYSGITAA